MGRRTSQAGHQAWCSTLMGDFCQTFENRSGRWLPVFLTELISCDIRHVVVSAFGGLTMGLHLIARRASQFYFAVFQCPGTMTGTVPVAFCLQVCVLAMYYETGVLRFL